MDSSVKKRVLCVDDTEDDRQLFSFILINAGYDVESAQSVNDALQVLENSQFDLYLFDMLLRDGTGLTLLEKVKEINPTTPVIICSGDARDSVRHAVMQAGAQVLLLKPVDIHQLIETTVKLLHPIEQTAS